MEQSNNKDQEIIDALISGRLNPTERLEIFDKMKTDKKLADEYAYRLNLTAALKNNRAAQIRKKAVLWERESNNTEFLKPKRARQGWLKYAVAATALCLIGIFWWSNNTNSRLTSDTAMALFTNNFTPAVVDIERNTDTVAPYVYYANKDYRKAIEELKKLTTEESKFFLANSFLAINEPLNALNALNSYNGEFYKTEVQWLTALAYLRNNESAKAKLILEKLTHVKGAYGSKAKKLLKAL